MHLSAWNNAKRFEEVYSIGWPSNHVSVLEIGSQDVNGTLRDHFPTTRYQYLGLDFVEGKGVDQVIKDPYILPIESDMYDVVISSSCFEHSEMFWLSFLEIMRVLKPWGICYLNVPSKGPVHEYPVDCWRFYPDSGIALQTWARHSGYSAVLLESYIDATDREWNDFTAVILKDSAWSHQFSRRISQGSGPWSHVRTGL